MMIKNGENVLFIIDKSTLFSKVQCWHAQ